MKIATKISRVDNDELENEYIDMLKNNPKSLNVFICPICITKVMSVGANKPTDKTISMGLDYTMTTDFPRQCPHCSSFLCYPHEVDLSGVMAFEKGMGIN